MYHSAYVNTEKFYHKYCEKNIENKKILDIGSYSVNGSVKPIFNKGQYIGVDMEKGPNVDVVANANNLPFEKDYFDVIVSISCFEHDDMFWVTFLEMCRVLNEGGYMYINAPSNGPYHPHPGDNWRFYKDSWKALEKWGIMNGYDIELVESYIDETTPKGPNEKYRIWNDSIGIFRKKPTNLNKVALISSFCDTQEKLDVLEKNIKIIKSHNLDVIVISPFNLPEHLTKQCNYFFITKDNPVLDWPIKSMYSWREINVDGVGHKITRTYSDYGFAGLTQLKQLSQIALGLDYNQFYHMIYDIKIDENVIDGFYSNRKCNVYPSKRGDIFWKVGLHYLIFDRVNLEKFISHINLDNYLSVKGGDAFLWLHNLQNVLPYINETIPVEDEIYYYEGYDFFNYSPIKEQPFFIVKDYETLENNKIIFYWVKEQTPFQLTIDDNVINDVTGELKIIDLGFNRLEEKQVKIVYNDVEYDITKIINQIKHNTFRQI
jgi:SAM-dependent methyltransferase